MAADRPEQRIALVTGVTAGTGEEIARRLLRDGFKVYVGAPAIHTVLGLFGTGAIPVALDTSRADDIIAVVDRIFEEGGGIDLLVNHTGAFRSDAANHVLSREARHRFELDLFGLTRLIKLLLPGMRKRGRGRIVNVSSTEAIEKAPRGSRCSVTRQALEGWSDCLRIEAAPFGVDVVLVEPGAENIRSAGLNGGSGTGAGGDAKSTETVARACEKFYERGRSFGPDASPRSVAGPSAPRARKRVM